MSRRNFLLFLFCFFISEVTHSSDDISSILKGESPSMYDFGILKLDVYLNKHWVGRQDIHSVDVSSFNSREIPGGLFISLWFDSGFFENSKEKCKNIINSFRETERVFKTTYSYSSTLSSLFSHTEYATHGFDLGENNGEYSSEFFKKVDDMFTIQALDFESKTVCWGKYNGKAVNITKW